MPFDLASLPYGSISRFKELAPFEFSHLKRLNLQHPITDTVPTYAIKKYFSFISIGPEKIKLQYYGKDYFHDIYITKESRYALLLVTNRIPFPANDESVDPAIVSQIVMQPEKVVLNDFKFLKSSFIFSHPCRRTVTKVVLNLSVEYTFTGGEFNLILETFPMLEELTINKNQKISDWLDDLIDSNFEKKPKLFVQFQGTALLSIQECKAKLAKLFEKNGSKLTLSLKLRKNPATAAKFVSELQKLGYSVMIVKSEYPGDEAYVKVRKDYPHSMIGIKYRCPTVFLDDVKPPHVEIVSWADILDDIAICMPSGDIALKIDVPMDKYSYGLKLTKTKKRPVYGRSMFLKNVHFEPTKLTVEKCDIDDHILEFTKPFCHHVKTLRLHKVRLPENVSGIPLFETFPNIEELHVSKLKYAFWFTDLFKLKSINIFECNTTSFWEFLRDNTKKVKEWFKQADSSFCLQLANGGDYPLDAMDKIRRLGFHVKLCTYNIYVYNGVQERIRLQNKNPITLAIYPDKIKHWLYKITSSAPKIEVMADSIILKTDQPSFKVKSKIRNKLILQPTIVKVTKCVDDGFFEFAKGFTNSLQHLDLRQCCCNKLHSNKLKERIRNAFPNLVKIWDRGDD